MKPNSSPSSSHDADNRCLSFRNAADRTEDSNIRLYREDTKGIGTAGGNYQRSVTKTLVVYKRMHAHTNYTFGSQVCSSSPAKTTARRESRSSRVAAHGVETDRKVSSSSSSSAAAMQHHHQQQQQQHLTGEASFDLHHAAVTDHGMHSSQSATSAATFTGRMLQCL